MDELYSIRNLFYTGSFQQVINEANSRAVVSEASKLERKVYLYRAYIAQGKSNIVISEIKDSDQIDLKVVKILATYLQSKNTLGDAKKEEVLKEINEVILSDASNTLNSTVQIIVGTIYYLEGLYEDALKVLIRHNKNLECVALIIQIYLQLDRLDLAKRELASTKTWAEDAMLAQLIEAWVGLKTGGDKYQEAYYIYEEIAQSPSSNTVKILNSQAVCNIHLGRYPEAESLLLEALNKNNDDPDTLVNLIVVSNFTRKHTEATEIINRYANQLKEVAPNHPFLQELDLKTSLFDRAAQRFALA
ncbi:1186_t:CDS:2 [Entrophospora sp. SA101]|nr:10365_t:CDS:2 [Entrophospora sp. SA101]CAJ0762114.1 1186_t:CDS:2 [Entrophospora sp. SA101]CAJ0841416.1 7396_t:CDS:2 [Entrophospora sp. SA101]CAJ0852851.1 22304_t:CDS:2 [Entrophospora sp. SA101]